MAEKNSLWKNIRKKAEQNRRTGAKPKKPTAEMLRQERKIKAKNYAEGGETDPPYRPLGIPMEGYEPDSVFYETPTRYSEPKQEAKPKPVNKKEDKPKPTSKRSEVQDYYLNQYLNQNSSTPKPDRYIAERDASSTKLSPAMSTKEWQEGPRDFNIVKGIQVALDLGQMAPNPFIAGGSYLASLPFTTYDVLDDLSKDDYKQAAVDALGYIPKLKNVGSLNTVIDATSLYNDVTNKANGGPVGDDGLYNMQRALELGYTPDETGHWPSVDSETGMWLKSKEHPTAWMEYMHGYALNPEVQKQYQHPVVNPEGYFGENQLQYNKKAEGGFTGEDDDIFKSNQNQGATIGKVSQDFLRNWVLDPEFARRLNLNFPPHASDLEKKIYGVKEARERASAANLKNINKVIPDIVSDIYDTQFLYNTNPEINTGLLSSYKSRLEDPKSIKALEKNLSTNPQGFTDEQGRIIITNEANTQYGPQSVGVHELIHKVSERDKTLDKLFRGKFQTPSQDRIDANYDKDEMYPFLMQMRFDNKFQPGEEITPERLKQIRDSGYRNHLFRYYNDDEISKYLNTLASNQTQAPIQYAAQGGKLYAEGDSIDPPSGTRYITPTRQDSLMLYNNALDKIRFYSSNPDYRKTASNTNFNNPQVRKNLIWDAFQVDPIVRLPLVEQVADNAASKKDAFTSGPKPSKPMSADEKRKMQKQVGVKKFGKVAGTNLTSLGDVVYGQPDVYYNPLAPPIYLHPNISPQGSEAYISQRLNDLSDIPNYDPLAVAPWDTLNEKQKEERLRKYGKSGTPLASTSTTRVTKPSIDRLQSKQYFNSDSNQQPGLVGNIENIQPLEINMDNFYEGQYEKYKRSPYEDPMYRVQIPGQKMQIVSEEEFKKLNDKYALKDLEQKAYGGPMQYKRGGLLKDIGLGVADFALSTIGGVTGIQSMKDIVNEKQYSNDKFDAGANFAGSIGSTALKLIPVTAPIANAAGIVGGAANKAFGIDAANYNPNQEVSDLEKAGNIVGQAGNVASMFMGNTSGVANVADAGKFMQGVNKINQFGQSPAGQLLNQGLSFEQGGNINNKSVNLQTDSMKNRYKNYRTKYKQGGNIQDKLEANGIVKIPSYVGYHYQHPDGGQPMGPDASVERDELVQLSGGGHTGMGTPEYVYPADVNNTANTNPEEGIYMPQMTSDYKMITDKYGMPRFTKKSPAKWLEEKLNRNSPFRTDVDGPTKESNDQAMAMAKGGREVAVSVNDLKQQAAQEDAMRIAMADNVAAYGGYLSKYRNLSMPHSSGGKLPKEVLRARVEAHMSPQEADAYVENYAKGGGIHIKESKKGTFTAAAKKHGMGVQEFASKVLANKEKYSAAMVKKANFARNASKWKHADGGPMDPPDQWSLPIASRSNVQQGSRNIITAGAGNNLPFTEQGTRIINEYDNGLPNDTSYSYKTPTENFFYNTGQNQPDGKPFMNYQGSNPNPNINDYLPKIQGLSRYAHGGPVVSNVNQDFDLYAQNRGGMMMANGGMMPQDNGMSKQIAAALQQGADPQELLQQLIESGMDPQQAQAMLQAIMGNIQPQVPTQAPMMAMGGRTMYAEGDDIPQYAGQLGKESWLTTAAGIGQVIPDVAAGIMAARALKKKDYEVKPFTVEAPKFNVEPIAIGMRGETASNKALMAHTLRNSGMTAAALRGSLAGYYGDQSKALGKSLTDLYTQKYNIEGQGQFQADMFNAKARADAAAATMQSKEGYMQDILTAGQGMTNKLANYYANRQKAGMQQWQAENTKSPYYSFTTADGKTMMAFLGKDGNYYDNSGNLIKSSEE